MERHTRVNLLLDAQQDLLSAIEKISTALEGTDDFDYADAYLISHLRNWAESGSSFDKTLPKYIDDMGNGETEIYED